MGNTRVAVAMPARNAARFVGDAARSVLAQNVNLELVVVDDASDDGTADVVQAIGDRRVRLLRTDTRRGIGWCHNAALGATEAPFVAHVDADDLIVPGALARMIAALERAPRAAQAYCHFTPVGVNGTIPAEARRAWERRLVAQRRLLRDPRRDLIRYGMVVNTLRTYRRDALAAVGPFDERLPYGIDYQMAVRLADRYEFVLVPEFLYLRRVHPGNVTESLRLKPIRFWWSRVRICRALSRRGRVRFLAEHPWRTGGLLAAGLLDALGGGLVSAALMRLRERPA